MEYSQDSRFSVLKAFIKKKIDENVDFEKIKSMSIKKGWPKKWVLVAYNEVLSDETNRDLKKMINVSIKKKKQKETNKSEKKIEGNHFFSKTIKNAKTSKKKPKSNKISLIKNEDDFIGVDAIKILTTENKKTQKYIEALFQKMDSRKHFYEKGVKIQEQNNEKIKNEKDNYDVLREAIKLAQNVVRYNNVKPDNSPKNQMEKLFAERDDTTYNKEEKTEKEDDKFSDERALIEQEREMLRRERELLEEDRKSIISHSLNRTKLKVPTSKKTQNKEEVVSKADSNVELKLAMLEEKLKNMDLSEQYFSDKKYTNDVDVEEIEFTSEPVGDRAQTGILGLDSIIQGGLRRLSSTLLAGGPGSGKTIFAMQFLINGITQFHEAGVYITFEQTKEELYALFAPLGWNLERLEKEKKLIILHYTPEQVAKMMKSGGGSLRDAIDSINASRIAIDSLSDLMMLFKKDLDKRIACVNLFDLFRKLNCTILAISEQEVNPLKHISNVLEYQVDGVILLYNERIGDIRQRAVEIFKMRGTKHAGRIFPMRITDSGIVILSNNPLK